MKWTDIFKLHKKGFETWEKAVAKGNEAKAGLGRGMMDDANVALGRKAKRKWKDGDQQSLF